MLMRDLAKSYEVTLIFSCRRILLAVRFIDASLKAIARAIYEMYAQWESASRDGLLHKIDPRIKTAFLAAFIATISVTHQLYAHAAMALFIFVLAALSRLRLIPLYRRVILFSFVFGFLVTFPSAFNVITKGESLIILARLSKSYRFWIYEIPDVIAITREGLMGVALVTLRVANSLALVMLVMHTTPFFDFIRSLKLFRVPDLFLMIVILSYKFIFIFSRTVEDTFLAMKARVIGQVKSAAMREVVAGRIFYLFRKSWVRYEQTFHAMQARGYDGEISLRGFGRIRPCDAAAAVALLAFCAAFIVFPRMI